VIIIAIIIVQIKEFVKHGKKDGYVEIELYEPNTARGNPVIRRKISALDESSVWYINDAVVRQADVSTCCRELE